MRKSATSPPWSSLISGPYSRKCLWQPSFSCQCICLFWQKLYRFTSEDFRHLTWRCMICTHLSVRDRLQVHSMRKPWLSLREVLIALGEDFILSRVKTVFSERWIDVHGKIKARLRSTQVVLMMPMPLWVLLNWQDTLDNPLPWCMRQATVCTPATPVRPSLMSTGDYFYLPSLEIASTDQWKISWQKSFWKK